MQHGVRRAALRRCQAAGKEFRHATGSSRRLALGNELECLCSLQPEPVGFLGEPECIAEICGARLRSWNGTPSAANSASFHPTPTPAISRPPDMRSSVASAFAVATGLRYGMISTETPTPMRVVCAAMNDIATNRA